MIEDCIEIISALPVVQYGQAAIIGGGVIAGTTAVVVHRIRTRNRKYRGK